MTGEALAGLGYVVGASIYGLSVVGHEAYRAAIEQRRFDEKDNVFGLCACAVAWPLILPAFWGYVVAAALGERGRRKREERAFQLRKERAQLAQLERELALEERP